MSTRRRGRLVLAIHWRGDQHSQLRVRKPKTGEHGCRNPEEALAVMGRLADRRSDADIAASLNRMGIRTGQGKTWTPRRFARSTACTPTAPPTRTASGSPMRDLAETRARISASQAPNASTKGSRPLLTHGAKRLGRASADRGVDLSKARDAAQALLRDRRGFAVEDLAQLARACSAPSCRGVAVDLEHAAEALGNAGGVLGAAPGSVGADRARRVLSSPAAVVARHRRR